MMNYTLDAFKSPTYVQTTFVFLHAEEKEYYYCDSYECPDKYDLVHGAEDIKCDYSGCTKHKCCEESES